MPSNQKKSQTNCWFRRWKWCFNIFVLILNPLRIHSAVSNILVDEPSFHKTFFLQESLGKIMFKGNRQKNYWISTKKEYFRVFPRQFLLKKNTEHVQKEPWKTKTIVLGDINFNNTSLQKNQQELEVFSKVIIKSDVWHIKVEWKRYTSDT